MDIAASLLLLLTVGNAAFGSPAAATPMQGAQHGVRLRRGVVDGLAKTILDPLNLLGWLGRSGSNAHSDSINAGATLPFGISAGISGSSSDAHSSTGDTASASSSSGGSGYPQANSVSLARSSRGSQGSTEDFLVPASYPGLVQSVGQPLINAQEHPVRRSNVRITRDGRLVGAGEYNAERDGVAPRAIVPGGIIVRGNTVPKYTGLPNNWSIQTNDRAAILASSQYGGLLGDYNDKESNRKAGDVLLPIENCGGDKNGCASA